MESKDAQSSSYRWGWSKSSTTSPPPRYLVTDRFELSQSLPGCDLHSQDFCYTDSESSSEGSYVDLVLNPERFTGYAGASAHRVWSAIYEENCFGLSEKFEMGGSAGTGGLLNGNSGLAIQEGFGQLKKGREEECVEKRIYYRIISGESG